MNIDAIRNGIVIDHITAGRGMRIYQLLNLDALRKSGLPRKMLALAAERSFPYNDQDILNILCYGRILFIPHPCNVMVYYLEHPEEISPALGLDYFRETAQPIILHFAGRAKPWYDPKDKRTSPWWQVAASFKGMDRLYFRYCLHKLYKKACPSAN